MKIIKCIYWLVGVDVILVNNTVQQKQGDPQHFSENLGKVVTVISHPKGRTYTEYIRRNEF
jgi:hypothetical protein